MILEITGTGSRNKGAELLLVAIRQRLQNHKHLRLAVTPDFGPYELRANYGLLHRVRITRFGRSKLAFALMPSSFRRTFGMVSEGEVDGIVDAAGFALGDQLPGTTARRFATDCQRWKSQGKPIVLLPQALGPFDKKDSRAEFRKIAYHIDLLFARDIESLKHAQLAAPEHADKMQLAPDITIGLDAPKVERRDIGNQTALLVPNVRMTDRPSPGTARLYAPFMARCARQCSELGLQPALLIHDDDEDHNLIEPICQEYGANLPVIREINPLKLKGILKGVRIVIGSRFHALVGSLSSGVPSIAVGWSHKYGRLMEDFQCPEMEVSVESPPEQVRRLISEVHEEHKARSANLRLVTQALRTNLDSAWKQVETALGVSLNSGETEC
jgi:polysaccharide pyruvyl transferase WcaK-like protein